MKTIMKIMSALDKEINFNFPFTFIDKSNINIAYFLLLNCQFSSRNNWLAVN